jgi:hypothetical protein
MKEEIQNFYILNVNSLPSETIRVNTDLSTHFSGMGIDLIAVSPTAPGSDDTHNFLVKFSCKIN